MYWGLVCEMCFDQIRKLSYKTNILLRGLVGEGIFDICEVTLHRGAELICTNMQERGFLRCRYVDL